MTALALAVSLVATAIAASAPPVVAGGAPIDGATTGDDLAITLVTFGPGDDITEWFGHSAIIVEDRARHVEHMYNYGEFAFDASTIPRYVLGHLTFHVGEGNVERTVARYRALNRSITFQELALTPEQRLGVANFLANNVKPENRNYLYDHYVDNCATKPRDIIDRFSNHALSSRSKPGRMTLRGHTRRHVHGVLGVLIDFAENGSIDHPITTWQEAFLPAELEQQVRDAGIVVKETQVFTAKRAPTPADPPALWIALLLLGTVVAAFAVAAAIGNRRRALAASSLVVSIVLGIPGTLAALLWMVTEHQVTHANANLLSSNPVTLLCAIPSFVVLFARPSKMPERSLRLLTTTWLVLALLALTVTIASATGIVAQDVLQWSAFAVPMLLGQAIGFRLLRR